MQLSAFSHAKRRDRSHPSDDTVLLAPGIVGVFDGATDARAQIVEGRSSGRFASETVAAECAALFAAPDGFDLPVAAIAERLNAALRRGAQRFEGAPTTTLALAAFRGDEARLIAIGDSGLRLNGSEVLRHLKPIDDVSAEARVRLFRRLATRGTDPDACEAATRAAIFGGLDRAVEAGDIGPACRDAILAEVTETLSARLPAEPIAEFLRGGIISQSRYANLAGHPLGYSALNGTETSPDDIIDRRVPAAEIHALEIFSDGYFLLPDRPEIAAWEAAAAEVEARDFHMLDAFANVKGATSTEFADDRAVVILDRR